MAVPGCLGGLITPWHRSRAVPCREMTGEGHGDKAAAQLSLGCDALGEWELQQF